MRWRLGENRWGVVGLALLLLLAWATAAACPARASAEAAALFYDALAPYGTWINYGHYGPVWYPTKGITASWRPYVDGRWLPTAGGWVFETSEPWGWATYHFGNWLPTTEYGWVWVPGSTWYPSTVAWRTNEDYLGWAPIPPPDYVPEPYYYPPDYYPGLPLWELLSPPYWVFVQAPFFLRGFGYPFFPSFSFFTSNALAPFNFVPVLVPRTTFVTSFAFFTSAPRAFFVFGPSFPFVARVTGVNLSSLNSFARSVNLVQLRNVLPPLAVTTSQPFIRKAILPTALAGTIQATQVTDPATIQRAQRQLVRPGVVPPPANLPPGTQKFPRVTGEAPQVIKGPGWPRAAPVGGAGANPPALSKGLTLPPESVHALTPGMQRQIRQQRRGIRAPSGIVAPSRAVRPPAPAAPTRAPVTTPSRGFTSSSRSAPAPAAHGGTGPGPPR